MQAFTRISIPELVISSILYKMQGAYTTSMIITPGNDLISCNLQTPYCRSVTPQIVDQATRFDIPDFDRSVSTASDTNGAAIQHLETSQC
jgi:hypothetical protein